jgi:hypothetical protein
LTVKTDDETMAMEILPKTETATEHLTVKAHDQSRTQQTRTKTRLQKSHTSKQQKGKGGKRQNQKRTNRGHTIRQQRPLSHSNLSTTTGLRSSRRHRRATEHDLDIPKQQKNKSAKKSERKIDQKVKKLHRNQPKSNKQNYRLI